MEKTQRDKVTILLWVLLTVAYIIVSNWRILANAPTRETERHVWMNAGQSSVDYHLLMTYDDPLIMSFCSIESLRAVTDGNIFVWTKSETKTPSHLDGAFTQRLWDREKPFSGTVFENHVFSGKYGQENVASA